MFYANADAHRVAPRIGRSTDPGGMGGGQAHPRGRAHDPGRTRQAHGGRKGPGDLSGRTDRAARARGRAERGSATRPGRRAPFPWPASMTRRSCPCTWPDHGRRLFHFFDRFCGELRDITLFHELLNKRGRRFSLTIGEPVAASDLPADPAEAAAMKDYVERELPRRTPERSPMIVPAEGRLPPRRRGRHRPARRRLGAALRTGRGRVPYRPAGSGQVGARPRPGPGPFAGRTAMCRARPSLWSSSTPDHGFPLGSLRSLSAETGRRGASSSGWTRRSGTARP